MPLIGAFSITLAVSLLTAVILVMTRKLHGRLTFDSHIGIQKLHRTPTPRIGGLALFFGAVVGGISLSGESRHLFFLIALSALPGFVAGLAEDLTKRVGVMARLLATVASGLIFCTLTGYSVRDVDIPGIDWILGFWLPSILFTAFAIGGIANAINIIDGVHGLSAGTTLIVLSSFSFVAWSAGDYELLSVTLIVAAAILGFLALNFPFGLIFFGDAGAYTAGFLLAVIAVMLPARNPELSPVIGLLALAYPVIETMVSIQRRIQRGSHPGQPDRLHLHSLVYRDVARRLARTFGRPNLRNPVTAMLMWALPLLSGLIVAFFGTSTAMMWVGMILVMVVYVLIYRRVALLSSRGRDGTTVVRTGEG